VSRWVQQNPDEDASVVLSVVRLPLMDLNDLLNVVRPTGLISSDAILDAIQSRNNCKDTELQYRGYMGKTI
jgi:BTB/POZ domain-containing protein 9